jgi:hypothetical protein
MRMSRATNERGSLQSASGSAIQGVSESPMNFEPTSGAFSIGMPEVVASGFSSCVLALSEWSRCGSRRGTDRGRGTLQANAME